MVAALGTLAPIERAETLGDRVDAHLRSLLMSGQLAPGDKLPLRSLAEALGVSMMPAREAVSRLVAEQALDVLPNRAVRVPVMSLARFREITRIRTVIEGFAAHEAALKADAAALKDVRRHEATFRLEGRKARPDLARAVVANQALHFAVYRAAAMPMLMQIIERLWLQIGPVLNLDLRGTPARLKEGQAIAFHAALAAALEEGDGEAARAAIAGDIAGAAAAIEARGVLKAGDIEGMT